MSLHLGIPSMHSLKVRMILTAIGEIFMNARGLKMFFFWDAVIFEEFMQLLMKALSLEWPNSRGMK